LFGAQLSGADLREVNFIQADLRRADLRGADLRQAHLEEANLSLSDFRGADLRGAHLLEARASGARFDRTKLDAADLRGVGLRGAKLVGAKLFKADVSESVLVGANFDHADLTGCNVHGISAWDLSLQGTIQSDLVITRIGEPVITVDSLEVAQFVYLLLNNEKVRQIIDTITSKGVLILGRFTDERKAALDAIREELRRRNFTPVMFDFDKPTSKDVTGTVETLARMARFIIADLTDPSSIPHELATIAPFFRTIPVLPLRLAGSGGYSMFEDFQRAYTWVLKTHEYDDGRSLISALSEIIAPADRMADELRHRS
jgi:hypothetical protein